MGSVGEKVTGELPSLSLRSRQIPQSTHLQHSAYSWMLRGFLLWISSPKLVTGLIATQILPVFFPPLLSTLTIIFKNLTNHHLTVWERIPSALEI